MNDVEIALLKAEVARLNKIITVLIEQNDVLKAEIAVRNFTNGDTEGPVAFRKVTNGNPGLPDGIRNITNGNAGIPDGIRKVTMGNGEAPVAFREITNGNPEVPDSIRKVTNGNPEVSSPLPAILPLDGANISRLYSMLKTEGFNKVHKSAITNASRLLLHFYNNGRGDHQELRKLTGLSKFGLAKYIRSLKKRGLIERDGWQKFKLTAYSLNIIRNAGCKG